MADANTRQVGGAHYAGEYQHWDFVADTKQDYFQGQASRYISRHRRKNGREDVEKALHFIDKAEELRRNIPFGGVNAMEHFWRFVGSQSLDSVEAAAIFYVMLGQWKQAREKVEEILTDMDPASGGEKGSSSA